MHYVHLYKSMFVCKKPTWPHWERHQGVYDWEMFARTTATSRSSPMPSTSRPLSCTFSCPGPVSSWSRWSNAQIWDVCSRTLECWSSRNAPCCWRKHYQNRHHIRKQEQPIKSVFLILTKYSRLTNNGQFLVANLNFTKISKIYQLSTLTKA